MEMIPATPLVLVENEVTAGGRYDHWQDVTGERYQFPNKYRNKIVVGRPFVYYRGVRRADGARGQAEYFGCGVIGAITLDPSSDPIGRKAERAWICEIESYRPFPVPVPARTDEGYLEIIPKNFWGVAVRDLPEAVYLEILRRSALQLIQPEQEPLQLELPPLAQLKIELAESLLLPQKGADTGAAAGRGSTARRLSKYAAALGRRGEEIALAHLCSALPDSEAATLRWVADAGETPGWDIEYRAGGQLIAVEVKATGGPAFPSVELTANEWHAAIEMGSRFYLCLVTAVKSVTPQVQLLNNPAERVQVGDMELKPVIWKLIVPQPK